MPLITPSTFLAAATGVIRMGAEAWKSYQATIATIKDVRIYLPPSIGPDPDDYTIQQMALQVAWDRKAWRAPDADLALLWLPDARIYSDINTATPNVHELLQRAEDLVRKHVWSGLDSAKGAPPLPAPPSVVLTHKAWLTGNEGSLWSRLGFEIARTGLEILGAQPGLIGVRGQAEKLVAGIAQNLTTIVADQPLQGSTEPFGKRALALLFRSTVTTLAENPSLALRDEHWAPVVAAFVKPLQDQLAESADVRLQDFALDRLESLLRGPMALGALQALSAHADDVMKGRVGADTRSGVVVRQILTDVVRSSATGGDVIRTFGALGVGGVLRSSLRAVEQRPELFVGAGADAKMQGFAAKLAGVLATTPRPFGADSGLAPEIAGIALDAASSVIGRRLVQQSGSSDWEKAMADSGVAIVAAVFDGFKLAAKPDPRVADTAAVSRDLFKGVFTRELAIDILKITASHIAKSPQMVMSGEPTPEATALAAGIARLVAQDTTGLLHAEDWRAVIAATLDLATKNPTALFGDRPSETPEAEIGIALTQMLFLSARENFTAASAKPGRLMFGATLRDALVTTLQASTTVVLSLQAPDVRTARIDALAEFVRRISAAAAGPDETLRMGAGEWLFVYRKYVAHVLDKGGAANVTDDMIRATLLGLENRRPS